MKFIHQPLLFALPLLAVTGMALYPVALNQQGKWKPFMASASNIFGVLGTIAASLFPYWVPSYPNLANSLTIYNASSSKLTLEVMLMLALIGMPLALVIFYSGYIYRKFKGTTKTSSFISHKDTFSG
ncbi:MAG: hypothetical protein FH758_05855 [Firmicutes bacterium]|nr:hypothetical protein [Bacillota bacterium]